MAFNPAVTDRSGEILAQGMNTAFGAISQGIMQFAQNQHQMKRDLGRVQAGLASNQEITGILDAAKKDPTKARISPETLKAFERIQSGKADVYDAALASSYVDQFAESKARATQQQMMEMQLQEKQRRAADEQRTRALYGALNSPAGQFMVNPAIQNNPYVQQGAKLFGATGQFASPGELLSNDTRMAIANTRAESAAEANAIRAESNALRWQILELKDAGKKKEDTFKNAQSLREGLYGLSPFKEFQTVDNYFSRGRSLAEQDTAAADIGLIFSYMKVLDPTSAVREGEYATAQNSGSLPDSIRNAYNKALNGEKLQPGQRSNFVKSMRQSAATQYSKVKPIIEQYTKLAEKSDIPIEDVVPPYYLKWTDSHEPLQVKSVKLVQ